MGKPTIRDVALRAGVSKSLVSLALRGSDRVSPASRQAIERAAAELGYRTNAAARSLAARHSHVLGVLLLDLHNPISADVVDGVRATATQRGYRTLLVTGGHDADLQRDELEALLELQVDGLILVSHSLAAAEVQRLALELPTVVVTRGDMSGPRLDWVCNDEVAGVGQAVTHLTTLGHTAIVHLTGGDDPVAHQRAEGYRRAMESHGLADHALEVAGSLTDSGGYHAAAAALSASPRPTAFVVVNDFAAAGALAAVSDAGLRVPDDVSVVGYDGMAIGSLGTIDLTSVAQPLRQMGGIAVELLLERIADPTLDARHVTVPARIVIRGTTAPPASARH